MREIIMKRQEASTTQFSPVDKVTSLLQYAYEGQVDAVRQILDAGLHVDSEDYDGRTALHLAASEGNLGVVELLLARGAKVNPVDRWRVTPWLNAERYVKGDQNKREEYKKVSERLAGPGREPGTHQAKRDRAEQREELEQLELLKEDYEIDIGELNLQEAEVIGMGSYGPVKLANWRGTKVAAKTILEKLAKREEIKKEFRTELLLLQSLRHPNIIEFLGAVTQNNNIVIVTEYLAKGDLHEIIVRRGRIPARDAVKYALDISRGMNYLHEHKPKAIIHRGLQPRNVLQDEADHLKVAGFGLSKLMEPRLQKGTNTQAYQMTGGTGSSKALDGRMDIYSAVETWPDIQDRYMAPEIFLHKDYDKSVDVFSFAIIVTEMFEGGQTLLSSAAHDVPQKRAQADRRSVFRMKSYPSRMKELLRRCCDKDPAKRPTFEYIIDNLENMLYELQKPMLTTAVNSISERWKDFQHKVQLNRYHQSFSGSHLLCWHRARKLGSRSQDSLVEGGSSTFGRGPDSRRGSASRKEEDYPWISTDHGSVSTFGRTSDDSSLSYSLHGRTAYIIAL